jgi:hypothetical protein
MVRPLSLLALCGAFALSALACGGADKRPDANPVGADLPDSAALLRAYAHLMPPGTSLFARVDMRALNQEHLPTAFGMLDREWDHAAMTRDLSRASSQRLGVDVTRASWCVIAGNRQDGVILCDEGAALDTYPAEQVLSDNASLLITVDEADLQAKLYRFKKEGVVAFAIGEDLLAALAQGQPVTPDKAKLDYLERLLRRVGDGDLTVAIHPEQLSVAVAFTGEAPPEAGVAFSVSERLVVAFQGDKAMIEEKVLLFNRFLEGFRAELGERLKTPDTMTVAELLAMTWVWHMLGPIMQQLQPAQEGDLLVYDLSTRTATHPVTVLGVVGYGVYYFLMQAFMGGMHDAFETPMQGVEPAPVEAPQPPDPEGGGY